MDAVKIKNMTKDFGTFSIRNLNLSIPQGYITGIVGKNGAGKTTIIKSVLGMMPLEEGEISVLGMPLEKNEITIKDKIGIVMNDGCFYEALSLIKMKNIISKFYTQWDEKAFQHYMDYFHLPPQKKVKELSTGMRAKYNIALALSHHADLIIMDEPSSGLDPVAREELMDILSDLMQNEEKTVILSTHITSDLDRTADYIVLVDNGQVLLQLPKDELLDTHRLLKGTTDQLSDNVKKHLISYKTNSYGFEALTNNAPLLRSLSSKFVFEKPTVEDILRFYARKDDNHVSAH